MWHIFPASSLSLDSFIPYMTQPLAGETERGKTRKKEGEKSSFRSFIFICGRNVAIVATAEEDAFSLLRLSFLSTRWYEGRKKKRAKGKRGGGISLRAARRQKQPPYFLLLRLILSYPEGECRFLRAGTEVGCSRRRENRLASSVAPLVPETSGRTERGGGSSTRLRPSGGRLRR